MPHLQAMTWDFQDQLRVVELSGGKAYYNYDGGGQRTRKVIERNGSKKSERLYLGGVERYQEYNNNGVVTLERWTLQVEDIAQVDTLTIDNSLTVSNPMPLIRYQYRDHLGSASMETNESGQVISYEEYHPFGTSAYRTAKSGTDLSLKRYRFTNKERDDETGLYYFGVRYYAAWLGRWTSSDPGDFVDGLNMYVYVRNNPVNGVDALGYETDPPPIKFPDSPTVGQTHKPEEGTNWTYVYGGKEDGWMPLGSIPEVTVTPQDESLKEITTGSFFGDLLMGEIPIVGMGIDIYNAYVAFSNGDILGGVLNTLSVIPLVGVAAKVGKKAWKAVSPYVDDIIEGHKQIGRDISSAWENTKELFRRGGGSPPPQLQGAGANVQIDVPPTPTPKRVEPQKPQQQKMEGNGPDGGDPPKKKNDPPKEKEVPEDNVDKTKKKKKKRTTKYYMSFADAAKHDANLLLKHYKKSGVGSSAGRSGGHGTPYLRAAAELTRRAKDKSLGYIDEYKDQLLTIAKRWHQKGKELNHPMR